MVMGRLLVALLLLAFPGIARAEWMQASSPNFVVYADASRSSIERYSQELERYHAAMAYVTTKETTPPSPSNRVTVYVVSNVSEVRRLLGDKSGNIAGVYSPRAGGSLAITPRVSGGGRDIDFSKFVLLHEYAHHFMISTSAFPMPRWYSEGSAEFFASASFEPNGDVWIGRPNPFRVGELLYAKDVTATNLLDPDTYKPPKGTGYDAFYGKSWTLFHYLVMNRATRKGQTSTYLKALVAGKSSREAGLEAFGDFATLERELESYLNKTRMLAFKLRAELLKPGPTTVRALLPGEAAMMPVVIQSKRGVDEKQAAELIIKAREIAARFPQDAAVLSALAEAEYDSGHDAEAIAAADRALAIDKTQVNAYIQKGFALFRIAEKSKLPADYRKARVPFLALNKIENDHPIPLIFNYRTALEETGQPPRMAVLGLERALELAPFDQGLRMNVAKRQLKDGYSAAAKANLAPIAYNPHGGGMAKVAQEMIARIDADPKWDGTGLARNPIIEKGAAD
jgi:tetratricopeptide (TPR) repeat protein